MCLETITRSENKRELIVERQSTITRGWWNIISSPPRIHTNLPSHTTGNKLERTSLTKKNHQAFTHKKNAAILSEPEIS